MSEFIEFKLIDEKPKTSVFDIINIKSGLRLGIIKWYGPWRQYCFFPYEETIFNMDCMQYIIDFIKELMEKRKK